MGENINEKKPKEFNISSAYLQKKLKALKKEHKNFTRSSSKTKKYQESLKKCNSFDHFLKFDNSSPRNLMSALQHPTPGRTTRRASSSFSYCSPSTVTGSSGEVWRVRENELANEERRRERKHAFESGKLRGRRLFDEEGEVSCEEEDDYDDVYCVIDEGNNVEVENVVKEEIKEFRKRKLGDVKCIVNGKMIMLISVGLLVFVYGVVLMGGFDEHVSEMKAIHPT